MISRRARRGCRRPADCAGAPQGCAGAHRPPPRLGLCLGAQPDRGGTRRAVPARSQPEDSSHRTRPLQPQRRSNSATELELTVSFEKQLHGEWSSSGSSSIDMW
ncbi:uncharacterized protein LOC124713009 [Schistocerca piceifrons]|uniref:uncharacterized protein LOC124713009 n=1 Tax=Schistocerca piceifrons TaxID=274613 RepID=UPI001F5F98BD|nr:uncharacterized protein LOC124713009 [Schistocerca piceifrons]